MVYNADAFLYEFHSLKIIQTINYNNYYFFECLSKSSLIVQRFHYHILDVLLNEITIL